MVALRYGLENGQPLSLRETGKVLGLSGERVRLIEREALRKLRDSNLINAVALGLSRAPARPRERPPAGAALVSSSGNTDPGPIPRSGGPHDREHVMVVGPDTRCRPACAEGADGGVIRTGRRGRALDVAGALRSAARPAPRSELHVLAAARRSDVLHEPLREELLGVPPEVFLEDESIWDELIHPDDRERSRLDYESYLRTGEPARESTATFGRTVASCG